MKKKCFQGEAVDARKRVLAHIADTLTLVAGMHIAFPAMGRIAAAQDTRGYAFRPLAQA